MRCDSDFRPLKLDPRDEADRYSIQLYQRVRNAADLHGKQVLEIGSGRGGGASFIARYLQPDSITAVDLSAAAIRLCRRTHGNERLRFMQGDAENLPVPSGSFDVVLNVESSHCYPSMDRFLGEVDRILRPDGLFLFADFRRREDMPLLVEQIGKRFAIVEQEFITDNVVRALELDSDRRTQLIQKRAPAFLHNGLGVFASVVGSPTFEVFSAGKLQYVRFVLRKRTSRPGEE